MFVMLHYHVPDLQSRAKGICDVFGLLGAVCAHTVPLLGSFMDLRTPEQFIFYLLLNSWLVVQAPQMQGVYVDFGCRLQKKPGPGEI